jgi:hypothetical protein
MGFLRAQSTATIRDGQIILMPRTNRRCDIREVVGAREEVEVLDSPPNGGIILLICTALIHRELIHRELIYPELLRRKQRKQNYKEKRTR